LLPGRQTLLRLHGSKAYNRNNACSHKAGNGSWNLHTFSPFNNPNKLNAQIYVKVHSITDSFLQQAKGGNTDKL